MPTVSVCQNDSGIPARVQVGDAVHAGGEGRVHFSVDGRYAVKVYHRTRPDKRRHLEQVAVIGQAQDVEDHHFLCWPLALVQEVDGVPAVGCVTRRVPTPPFVQLYDVNYAATTAVKWFRSGKIDWSHLLQIARGVGRSVAVLHGRGCAHADLNNHNFLVNPTPASCDVVLIDLDGIVVPGWLDPQVKGTMGIIAPEVLAGAAEPGESSDRHSLAVQILQTLLLRNPLQPLIQLDTNNDIDDVMGWGTRAVFSEHATNTLNRPRMLGLPLFRRGAISYRMLSPALQTLTYRSLVEGLHHPSKRPSARDWIRALSWCLDELHQCTRCGLHYPYPHWNPRRTTRTCPFCGQITQGDGNTVFWLYEPSREGQYSLLPRHIVLAHGWSLFADVVQPQTDPPMSRQAGNVPPVAHLEFDVKNKINRLVCDGGPSWHVQTGRDAPVKMIGRNESTSLEPGTVVRFGQEGRVVVVKE